MIPLNYEPRTRKNALKAFLCDYVYIKQLMFEIPLYHSMQYHVQHDESALHTVFMPGLLSAIIVIVLLVFSVNPNTMQ
jgi:hypothetical protein